MKIMYSNVFWKPVLDGNCEDADGKDVCEAFE